MLLSLLSIFLFVFYYFFFCEILSSRKESEDLRSELFAYLFSFIYWLIYLFIYFDFLYFFFQRYVTLWRGGKERNLCMRYISFRREEWRSLWTFEVLIWNFGNRTNARTCDIYISIENVRIDFRGGSQFKTLQKQDSFIQYHQLKSRWRRGIHGKFSFFYFTSNSYPPPPGTSGCLVVVMVGAWNARRYESGVKFLYWGSER